MTEEMLQKSMGMFDTPEKWSAFTELANAKEEIRNRWYQKLQRELMSLTSIDANHTEWTCTIWNAWDIEWKLKDYPSKFLSLHSWSGYNCRLWIRNTDEETCKKVYELMDSNPLFRQMQTCFSIRNLNQKPFEAMWDAQFNLNCGQLSLSSNTNELQYLFAWYAGNDTNRLARQIMEQVNRIRTPEMTGLFRQVDELINNG